MSLESFVVDIELYFNDFREDSSRPLTGHWLDVTDMHFRMLELMVSWREYSDNIVGFVKSGRYLEEYIDYFEIVLVDIVLKTVFAELNLDYNLIYFVGLGVSEN